MSAYAAEGVRQMTPMKMAMEFVKTGAAKIVKNKARADGCNEQLPPRVKAMLQVSERRIEASRDGADVEFFDDNQTQARVYPNTNSTNGLSRFNVVVLDPADLQNSSCSCNFRKSCRFPCEDEIRTCLRKGRLIEELVHNSDRTAAWQVTYSDVELTGMQPTTDQLADCVPDFEMYPPAYVPKKSGRPAFKRWKMALEGGQSPTKRQKVAQVAAAESEAAATSPLSTVRSGHGQDSGRGRGGRGRGSRGPYKCRSCGALGHRQGGKKCPNFAALPQLIDKQQAAADNSDDDSDSFI